jgi:hypothetical protein
MAIPFNTTSKDLQAHRDEGDASYSQWRPVLCCPACHHALRQEGCSLVCEGIDCGTRYPIVGDVPILIHEPSSIFPTPDSCLRCDTGPQRPNWKSRLRNLIPSVSRNVNASPNFRRLGEELLGGRRDPRVLVIGGRMLGDGFADLLQAAPSIRSLERDVRCGLRSKHNGSKARPLSFHNSGA